MKPVIACGIGSVALLLNACAFSPIEPKDSAPSYVPAHIRAIPDPVPKVEPYSRYGNPETYYVYGKQYRTLKSNEGFTEKGLASWYGTKFHGRSTSSGEPYDMYAMTAAHKTLPIPSYARVKNLQNGKEIIVRINDRGPFHDGRILDLSYAAAIKLGVAQLGTAPIELHAISPGEEQNTNQPLLANKANADAPLYIQVGAYRQSGNAEKIREKLERAALVHTVEVAQFKKEYNTLYRVRIGPVANRQEAEAVADSLRDLGIRESQIVSE